MLVAAVHRLTCPFADFEMPCPKRRRRVYLFALLFSLATVTGLVRTWASWLDHASRLEDMNPVFFSQRPMVPTPCFTDLGRPIPVLVGARPATPDELARVRSQMQVPNLICTAPPGPECNCHGWVFSDGRYWIDGTEVPNILADNGYEPVLQPRAGDLIVYRIGDTVEHTGIVRVADKYGVLIESKWGPRGRYVHLPEHQDYATDFAYFRSRRPGHLLRNSPPLTESSPVSSLWTMN